MQCPQGDGGDVVVDANMKKREKLLPQTHTASMYLTLTIPLTDDLHVKLRQAQYLPPPKLSLDNMPP